MITKLIIILLSILTLTGCGHNGSGSVYIPEEKVVLNINGNVNLKNINFPYSISGENYQFRDLSVFNINVQDDSIESEVSTNGQFSLNELSPRQQIVIRCIASGVPNLCFEWMGASTSGLSGDVNATVSLYSTARAFIARALRDRYGRRIKPESIPDEYIETTVLAIVDVIENNPDKLKYTRLDQIDSVIEAYTTMADKLAKGNSGNFPISHTFLFYMAGDNDLGLYMQETIKSITEIGQIDDAEIIIGFDTAFSLPVLNKPGAARYRVVGNKLEVLNDLGELDSTDSNYLKKFIELSMREYPSKDYSLIISSHGGVWRDKAKPAGSSRAIFANDFNSLATGTVLNFALSIESALAENNASNRKFSMIVLDSCNMASIETAYEFSTLSNYTVFSQALMPASGIPYFKLFNELKQKGIKNVSAFELSKILADKYAEKYIDVSGSIDTGITVLDNSAMPDFMVHFNEFLDVIWKYKEDYLPVIYNIRTAKTINDGEENTGSVLRCFSPTNEFIDLTQFCNICIHDKQMYFLNEKYDLLKEHFEKLIVYSKYSNILKNANGISITFPEKEIYQYYYQAKFFEGKPLQPEATEYFKLKFCNSTKWVKILNEMLK